MVAVSGTGWRLAPCLVAMFEEADKRDPNRDRTSDGSIGDPAHAARTSDHNPADGWVCAADIDDDNDQANPGVDLLRAHLVAVKDQRVKYLIRNGTIWKAYPSNGLPAWAPQVYTGINDHSHHLHISVWNTAEARNDVGPWWPPKTPAPPIALPEDDMADPIFYDDPDPAHPGTYMLHPTGKVAGNLSDVDAAELKKAVKDPGYTAKLSKAGAAQLRKVFIQ